MLRLFFVSALLIGLGVSVCSFHAFSQTGQMWSANDWHRLIRSVNQIDSKAINSEFVAGERVDNKVKITFKVLTNNKVFLAMDGPGEYILEKNPNTGLESSRKGSALFFIIDDDMDGVPDRFSDRTSPYRDRKKYFNVNGDDLEESILMLWNIGVSFTINKHLYKTERVFRD